MMDSYQAIYDAVRSKISNGDVGSAVSEVARHAFDISWGVEIVKQEYISAAQEQQRPCVLFKPDIFPDGTMWCALLGQDLMTGICGFGETPAAACAEFDAAFWKSRTPDAIRQAKAMEASGQDPTGLDAKHDSAVAESHLPETQENQAND